MPFPGSVASFDVFVHAPFVIVSRSPQSAFCVRCAHPGYSARSSLARGLISCACDIHRQQEVL